MRDLGSLSLWTRIAAVAAIAASPFVPAENVPGKGRAVMYVVDRSASIGPSGRDAAVDFVQKAWEARGSAEVGLVAFEDRPQVIDHLGATPDRPHIEILPGSGGTDIAAAIRLAAASLPSGGQRRIVLLSDGRATRGDALAEVARAAQQGITVDAVPIAAAPPSYPVISRMAAREPSIAEGEPVALVAEVRGKPDTSELIEWLRDGKVMASTLVKLDASGLGVEPFADKKPGSGMHVYEARLPRPNWTGDMGRSGLTAVTVGGKPRALVLTIDGQCPAILCDALDKSGVDKRVVGMGETTVDEAALSAVDLVVLADLPLAPADPSGDDAGALAGLPPRGQTALIEFAQRGGGVIVTGGAFGFAPEYGGALIAKMLPVEIEDQGQVEDPKVAMAIMLDRSGSMAASVGKHTKIELAVEASLAAASTLRPDDSLALGSVDEKTHWNQPLGPVAALEGRKKEIRSIDAGGGGIYVYTALTDAYRVLQGADAPVRHVILFSDTADSEEQTETCISACGPEGPRSAIDLAETARKAGITTSVVGIGRDEDSDTPFLKKLAAAARGRFYLTGDGADLRRIFVSEARVAARSNLREGKAAVMAAADHPILAGIDIGQMPPLGGFVEARRRATADTALVTRDDNKPIVASWRYGLGKVVALTTDLRENWKDGWATWGGAGQALRQMVRFALRRHGAAAADVRVSVRDRAAELTVDVPQAAGEDAAPPSSIEAFAIDKDGTARPLNAALTEVAPGRWVARAATQGEPFVVARVRDAGGGFVGEVIGQRDGASELAGLGPDERALGELARAGGGMFQPEPQETVRAGGPRGTTPMPTWPALLVLAASLVAADLWLRRVGKRRAAAFLLPRAA